MSRREEVEKLKNVIGGSFGDDEECHYYGNEALDELAALAISSIPDRYTPREEVTEGWWSCVNRDGERQIVYVWDDHESGGDLRVDQTGTGSPNWTDLWTDFLPVPAWLVEGIGEQPK